MLIAVGHVQDAKPHSRRADRLGTRLGRLVPLVREGRAMVTDVSRAALLRHRILVIDDEPSVRALVRQYFEMQSFEVEEAPSAHSASDTLDRRSFDLSFLDVGLGDGSGFDLLDHIRREHSDTSVVMLSARDDAEAIISAIRQGADDYIVKPCSTKILRLVADRVLERRRLVRENLEYRRRLEQSLAEQRRILELKDEMTAMVVHDLKQPLTQVLGHLELATLSLPGSGPSLPQEHIDHMDNVRAGCNDILRMVQTLLGIVQMETGEVSLRLETVSTRQLIAEAIRRNHAVALFQKHELVPIPSPDVLVCVDLSITNRMLDNLIANAIKYTPEGSHIDLAAIQNGSGSVHLIVADNGPGIPEKYHDRVFERHGRRQVLRDLGRGDTGFGLAFCKMAAAQQGGSIRLESREGHGCRFIIEVMPAAIQPPGIPLPTQATIPGGAGIPA